MWLRVSLKDGTAWGTEISGDSIDLAPAFRAAISELEAERERMRDALKAIRRHIDSPAHYDKGIDDLCEAGLGDTNGR
jgi:hypothetical protein